MDIQVTLICAAADKTAAQDLASQFPGGSGTFSVPLSTSTGVTDAALATHWAGSGWMPQEMVDAFNVSVSPMYKVFPLDNQTFDNHLALCTPRLYRIIEGI